MPGAQGNLARRALNFFDDYHLIGDLAALSTNRHLPRITCWCDAVVNGFALAQVHKLCSSALLLVIKLRTRKIMRIDRGQEQIWLMARA